MVLARGCMSVQIVRENLYNSKQKKLSVRSVYLYVSDYDRPKDTTAIALITANEKVNRLNTRVIS